MMAIKNRYLDLINAIEHSGKPEEEIQEDLECVLDFMTRASEYVSWVYRYEIEMPMIRLLYQDEQVPERIHELDQGRRNRHDALISGVKILNRLCDLYGVERVFQGDTGDRWDVANFAGDAVQAIFSGRGAGKVIASQDKKK